jgi:hypothetical protein
MSNTAVPRGEIVVDDRGRTSLAKVRTRQFTRYLADEHEDGTIVLTPAVTVTPDQLERLRELGADAFLADPHRDGTRRQRPDRLPHPNDEYAELR